MSNKNHYYVLECILERLNCHDLGKMYLLHSFSFRFHINGLFYYRRHHLQLTCITTTYNMLAKTCDTKHVHLTTLRAARSISSSVHSKSSFKKLTKVCHVIEIQGRASFSFSLYVSAESNSAFSLKAHLYFCNMTVIVTYNDTEV